MAKKDKDLRDSDGFLKLNPIPGGRFDQFIHKKKPKKSQKLPKDSNEMLESLFTDKYATDAIADMAEVDIGDYVYDKGLTYALNMNVGRNIPWLDDGLKSVERRILYTMYRTGLYRGSFNKVATVCGNMVALYHPHGDAAIADTIYRLGRSYSIMLPYIANGGNYGNMDDMRPAAPRYASASLTPYAMDCFFSEVGSKYPLFDVKDNYHYSEKEPIYLISKYPNILMQWNQGIGKGAASWLGAFNSKDIFQTTLKLLENPDARIDIYPDTPVPIDIINKKELKHCFDKKKFPVKMRAKYEVVADKKRDDHGKVVDKFTIVFTSLPLNVTGQVVKREIIDINEKDQKRSNTDKRIPEVLNVESVAEKDTPGGIQLIVEYEKGYDPNALAEKLFKSTSLETTVSVRYVLVSDNQPKRYTPREILMTWINQRYDQKRRYIHQLALKAAKDRAKLEASCILLQSNNIDKAIDILKKSKDEKEQIQKLMKEFGFTEFQANIVIQLQLRSLSRMSVDDLTAQRDKAVADYKHYRKILSDETAVKELIRADLEEGMKKYSRDRIADLYTLNTDEAGAVGGEKILYWNSDEYFAVSNSDDIKQLKGKLDKSYRQTVFQNNDNILLISKTGMIKLLDGFAFTNTTSGIAMTQAAFPDVVAVIPLSKKIEELLMVSSSGYGKIIAIDDVLKSTKSKIVSLFDNDYLAGVVPVTDQESGLVVMCNNDRMYYARPAEFPKLKRNAAGNRILKLAVGDLNKIFYMNGPADHIMVYGENGYVKVLDTRVLKFNHRKPAYIDLQGKSIIGAIPINNAGVSFQLQDETGHHDFAITVDNVVSLTTKSGETQKLKIGTTISSPVKIFKKTRNDFYQLTVVK